MYMYNYILLYYEASEPDAPPLPPSPCLLLERLVPAAQGRLSGAARGRRSAPVNEPADHEAFGILAFSTTEGAHEVFRILAVF